MDKKLYPINEGPLNIPAERLKRVYRFLSQIERTMEGLKVEGVIGLLEFLDKIKKFESIDLAEKDDPTALMCKFIYDDHTSHEAWTETHSTYLLIITLNMAKFVHCKRVPDKRKYVVTDIYWTDFYSTFMHEYAHVMQIYKSNPDVLNPISSKKPYFDNPHEQQAWAEGYLEQLRHKLKTTNPKELLANLRAHGIFHDRDLRDLKKDDYEAWKKIMKQAIMSALSGIKDKESLPWQKDKKVP